MTGAIPVTKIVPARPITKAPHQPVSRFNPPEAYCSSSEAEVCLESGAMDLAPPLAVSRRARRRRQIHYQEIKFLASPTSMRSVARVRGFFGQLCPRECAV